MSDNDFVRISVDELESVFRNTLIKHGLSERESAATASIFVRNASDGIMTHSVARFPRLIAQIDAGVVKPGINPSLVSSFSAIERYDAGYGVGTTTASFAMDRAVALSDSFGVGIASLSNANHWMRAGYYALYAAERGKIGICWTNTMHNLASWGSMEANIGNNPIAIAVPRCDGRHFIIDSAMSQFSVGKVSQYAEEGKKLPVAGGFDREGRISDDPAEILKSWRFLPAGFWKGSGFSIVLDAIAAILSDGRTVSEIGDCDALHEAGLSQVFIAIDPEKLGPDVSERVMASIESSLKNARTDNGRPCRYPGENMKSIRDKSEEEGIAISSSLWNEIIAL